MSGLTRALPIRPPSSASVLRTEPCRARPPPPNAASPSACA
ncbi:hypothetical protein [Lysobacter gummosus]